MPPNIVVNSFILHISRNYRLHDFYVTIKVLVHFTQYDFYVMDYKLTLGVIRFCFMLINVVKCDI